MLPIIINLMVIFIGAINYVQNIIDVHEPRKETMLRVISCIMIGKMLVVV